MDALSPLFLVLLVGGFYFLAVRPQKARLKAVRDAQAALAPGQQVMTTAGLYGTVTAVDAEDVRIEVAPGVELRFARGAVARLVPDPDDTAPEVADPAVEVDPSPVTPG